MTNNQKTISKSTSTLNKDYTSTALGAVFICELSPNLYTI